MTMPQMSGMEALTRIRAKGSNIPVLLSSGYSFETIAADSPKYSGYLQKPYDVNQLLSAVAGAIAGALNEQALR
jgi:CheY-like chemotaxis protein